jgi:RNA polymerase sigma-70 factor (family 1)
MPQDWFLKIAQGDEAAFTQAFYHYNKRIYPYLLKKLHSPDLAREMVQDVFLKLWLIRDKLHDIPNPEPYLFRMVANLLQDFYRKAGHEYKMKNVWLKKEGEQVAEPEVWRSETRKLLNEAVQELPPERKKVYLLRMEGHSYEEIAEMLGVSIHTVRNQLASATRAIKEILRSKGLSAVISIILWRGF